MLTELSLENFKSWKQVDRMRLAPITGLFGTNSSGKTSILQLLLLLKQTAQSPDRMQVLDFGGDDRDLVELGSFRDVVHAHSPAAHLSWGLKWELSEPLRVENVTRNSQPPLESSSLMFQCSVNADDDRRNVSAGEMSYTLGETRCSMRRSQPGEYRLEVSPNTVELGLKQANPFTGIAEISGKA